MTERKMYAGRFYLCKKCSKKRKIELNFQKRADVGMGLSCADCGKDLFKTNISSL